jgi:hypothetical protein
MNYRTHTRDSLRRLAAQINVPGRRNQQKEALVKAINKTLKSKLGRKTRNQMQAA